MRQATVNAAQLIILTWTLEDHAQIIGHKPMESMRPNEGQYTGDVSENERVAEVVVVAEAV